MKVIIALFSQIVLWSASAATLGCLILLLKRIFRGRLEAKWHYYIWFLLVIKLLIPYAPESNLSMFNAITPVIQQVSGIEAFYPIHANRSIWDVQNTFSIQQGNESPQVNEKNSTGIAPSASNAPDAVKAQSPARSENNHYQDVLQIVFFIWLTGFILLICFTTYQNKKFRKKISYSTPCTDQRINIILDECIEKVGVKRRIPVFQTLQTRAPSLYGVIKPKILISAEFLEILSDDELKYILFHELCHYKRKDILTNWIITILQLIHWFNPIVWYSFYIMRQDCEIACDAQVLSCLEEAERIKYGQTIINILKVFTESYLIPSTAGLIKSKLGLKRRITMISVFKKKSWVSALGAVALIAVVAIVGLPSPKLLANSDEVIHFKDSNIQAAVEESLKKPAGSTIYKSDMQKVKDLHIEKVSYADDILYCTNLENLRLYTPIDFKLLGNIKSLKWLSTVYDISDLKDIKYCKNLKTLHVMKYTARDTSTFSDLTELKSLIIGFQVSNPDISGLKSLEQLNTLGFYSLKGKSNLDELSSLKQLNTLILTDCPDLENIDSLSFLSELWIRGATELTDKSFLAFARFKNLRTLSIEKIATKDLKFLEKLTDLESLSIMTSQIEDISPLKNLTKLTSLDLGENKISDISVLASLKKLEYIGLDKNRIENLEPLSSLKNVEYLTLNGNRISNINTLASMKKLKTLYLEYNQITDITVLGKLVELNEIDLRNNKITDVKPLAGLTKIAVLLLKGNNIKDYSPISSFYNPEDESN